MHRPILILVIIILLMIIADLLLMRDDNQEWRASGDYLRGVTLSDNSFDYPPKK
jgi:hypothetical protein